MIAITLGNAAQVGDYKMHLPVILTRLAPVTSHLEGVGNYHAACAAITLVHYTPPPFIAIIIPCIFPIVKLLMKIRLESMAAAALKTACKAGRWDFIVLPYCEYFVNGQGGNKFKSFIRETKFPLTM